MAVLKILLILTISGVVFVNGWTDAPNAIAGAVSTGAMPYRKAVGFAALFNLLGLLVMTLINSSVADTITGMADFGTQGMTHAFAALLAAMAAIVIFAVAAWYFGIPTSESHALIAALSGAAIAADSIHAINPDAWKKVLAGLGVSLLIGLFLGLIFMQTLGKLLEKLSAKLLDRMQIISAGIMAFMHGAQDGQKFAAVFVIADMLAKNEYYSGAVDMRNHMLALTFCAGLMALGTSFGGKRIIETVGTKMVALKKPQSVCADLASGLCLLFASFSGIPMSTTHTKTSAIMGTGIPDKKNPADKKIIGEMFFAWGITFPVCGLLGFLFTKFLLLWL